MPLKSTVLLLFVTISFMSFAPELSFEEDVLAFQKQLNKEYKDSETSPLLKKDRKKFSEHNFFPINEDFKVIANFEKIENPVAFKMKTSTDRLPVYETYGIARFKIKGKDYQLSIYQSTTLRLREDLKDHLFLLYTDLTSGETTYGGGRYIDLIIPEGNTIVIDFNKSYHPYCAYNHSYSCPVPPKENFLDLNVEAGIKNLILSKKKKKKK